MPKDQQSQNSQDKPNPQPSPPSTTPSAIHSFIHDLRFQMTVESKSGIIYHTYTSSQNARNSSSKPPNATTSRQNLDPATSHHQHTEFTLINSSLNLLYHYPPPGSSLILNPSITIANGIHYQDWTIRSSWFVHGTLVNDERQGLRLDTQPVDLHTTNIAGTHLTDIKPKMNASWWASSVMGEIVARIREAKALGDGDAVQKAEGWARELIEGISIVQDIWATSKADGSLRKVATLLWSFRQAGDGEVGTATWRELLPSKSLTGRIGHTRPSL